MRPNDFHAFDCVSSAWFSETGRAHRLEKIPHLRIFRSRIPNSGGNKFVFFGKILMSFCIFDKTMWS